MRARVLVGCLVAVACIGGAWGGNHYVRSDATGSGDGSSWTNAYPVLPASLVRGDTYYVADGTYPSHTFNDATSGTAAITVNKATSMVHGDAADWKDAYGYGTATFVGGLSFKTSYLVIDGQTRGADWKSGYGFKIDETAMGTDLSDWKPGILVNGDTADHVTIRYVEIQGHGHDSGLTHGRQNLVWLNTSVNDWTISECYLHDSGDCIFYANSCTNVTIEYCHNARNESTQMNTRRESMPINATVSLFDTTNGKTSKARDA